jgi:hypothetical protein
MDNIRSSPTIGIIGSSSLAIAQLQTIGKVTEDLGPIDLYIYCLGSQTMRMMDGFLTPTKNTKIIRLFAKQLELLDY